VQAEAFGVAGESTLAESMGRRAHFRQNRADANA
jgi:hypothetical protein